MYDNVLARFPRFCLYLRCWQPKIRFPFPAEAVPVIEQLHEKEQTVSKNKSLPASFQ